MGIVICLIYPLEQFDSEYQPIHYGLYDALSRVFWSIALSYIIFACSSNAGGYANRFLSHPIWRLQSRMSYPIYMVNYPLIIAIAATMKVPFYYTHATLFQQTICTYIAITLVSAIAALMFESPIIMIEKIIFGYMHKSERCSDGSSRTVRQDELQKKAI